MTKGSSKYEKSEIELSSLIRVFISKKWWFIGSFIIIFTAGILFTFLRTPQFSLTSIFTISGIEPDYYQSLSQSFPEKTDELIEVNNISESKRFFSEDFLKEAVENIEFKIDIDELKDTIFLYTSKEGFLKLTTVYNDPEETYEINKVLFNTYLSKREYEINQAYEDLLEEIDLEISSILNEIKDLSVKASVDNALVDKEIELKYEDYYSLEKNRDMLIENKEYFVERIEVYYKPDISNVYGYFDYKRDLIFSFFLAVAIGLIMSFSVNYFQSLRK